MPTDPITPNHPIRRRRHEGKRKHVITFIFSLALTLIAFAAAGSAGAVDPTFTIMLLLVMAVLQVMIQMAFWMHMKDKGHRIPIIGIISGAIIAFTAIVMSVYWVWW